jgi:hypothetical protein
VKIEMIKEIRLWDALLHDFEALSAVRDSESEFEELLKDFDHIHAAWREEQKSCADGFNILQTLGITRKELCHSDVLAWLLDNRIDGYGTHCQGSLGFSLFLKEVNLPDKYASKNTNYRVIREHCGRASRLDIIIEAAGQFIIAIENKVDSKEGEDQTNREWADLQRRKKTLNPNAELMAFFLTPDQTKPSSKFFKQISWQSIANVFQSFADQAEPDLVKIFARHYAETLRREIVLEPEIEDTDTK